MSTYSAGQAQSALAQLTQSYTEALSVARSMQSQQENLHTQAKTAYDAATTDLVSALVPELSDEALRRAATLTGCVQLVQGNLIQEMGNERARLGNDVATIEANQHYIDRELLTAPRVGTLTRQIDELEDFRAPLQQVLSTAVHERLETLLENNYGTDRYAVPWWRLSYYRDWKAGDEILARFPDKKTFAEVREEVVTARQTIAVYDAQLFDFRAQVADVQALVAAWGRAQELLGTLDERHLAHARQLLVSHLEGLELVDLGERLSGDAEVGILAKRWGGMAAKLRYLDAFNIDLQRRIGALQEELVKIQRDANKAQRPKNAWRTYDSAPYEKRAARVHKMRLGLDRYADQYNVVYRFDRYDRGSFAQDFLWWDLMTDGRIDGDFVPEVADWRARHPHYQYDRSAFRDDEDARAAASIVEADRSESKADFVDAS